MNVVTRSALFGAACALCAIVAAGSAAAQSYPPGTNCRSLLPNLRAVCMNQVRQLNGGMNTNSTIVPNSAGANRVQSPGVSTNSGTTVTPSGNLGPNAVVPNGTVNPNQVQPNSTVNPNAVQMPGTSVNPPNTTNPAVIVPPPAGSTGTGVGVGTGTGAGMGAGSGMGAGGGASGGAGSSGN